MSDHAMPTIQVQVLDTRPGPGFWKLNTSYLDDPDYQNLIKNIIAEANEQYNDAVLKWEMIKLKVRGETIKFTAQKAKARKNKLEVLERKLKYYSDFDTPDFLSDDNFEQIQLIKKDIAEILNYKTQGALIRNKCNWYEGGEKVSKYFFNLERVHAKNKIINQIKNNHGNMIQEKEKVMTTIHQYYSNLFKAKENIRDPDYLADITIPKVSNSEQKHLNAPISKQEMVIAAKQLKIGKCPGEDGLPIEWYTTFWPHIVTPLHAVYIQNIINGCMHGTASHSIISLMPKPKKDITEIKNWRPLSLLNCDYKIYAKMIANRLQIVLPELISTDQTGFVKGRDIADNIKSLNVIIEYCKENQIDAILTAYDFQQAFDSCEWSAMTDILRAYGFQHTFINMVMTCYRNFQTRILNNGYPTRKNRNYQGK